MILLGQQLSYIFGIITNVLFLFVFVPTLLLNYRLKNSDAISFSLLYCLILGDIFSVISANYKKLNQVIIYSGIFHIFLDLIVIIQVLYYRGEGNLNLSSDSRSPPYDEEINEEINEDEISDEIGDEIIDESVSLISFPTSVYFYNKKLLYLRPSEFIFACISIIFIIICKILLIYLDQNIGNKLADTLGWLTTLIFISSRIPQIILNYQRKSTEGLSILSFIIINICNFFFFLSIVILLIDLPKENHLNFILENIQWIVGSTCTILFDCIIFSQFIIYRIKNRF